MELSLIHISYYLLGALLGRFKKAEVALPGGCNFGTRPIDLHLKGFKLLGADVEVSNGIVKVSAEKLTGTQIYMDQVSVGATINIMLAASMAEGTTIIENAAKEPHVVDTCLLYTSEYKTAEIIKENFDAMGIPYESGIGETGVCAHIGEGDYHIAVVCDIDAVSYTHLDVYKRQVL